MPTYCKYCHESGHIAANCSKSPSNKCVRFACLKPDHIRAHCTEKARLGKKRRRNLASSPSLPPLNEPIITNAVSVVEGRISDGMKSSQS